MTIQFGTVGIPLSCPSRSYKSGLSQLSKLGLNALEIQFPRGVRMKGETAVEINNLSKQRKISLSSHAPYYINLNTQNKNKICDSKLHIIQTAEIAKLMNSDLIIFNPGFYSKKSQTTSYNNVKNNLCAIREELDSKGLNDILLGPKTTGRQRQFGTQDEIISLSSDIEGVCPVLDFGHIYARRNGAIDSKNAHLSSFYKIERALGSDALKNIYIRFSAVEYKQGNEIRHVILEFGSPNFEHLSEAIKEMNVSGTIICKSPILEEDALRMKKIYESKQSKTF